MILALHETLLRHGVAAAEPHRLIYDIGWSVHRQMAEPPWRIASAFMRDPRKRLELATDLLRSFPFGSPSYEWRDVASPDGAIGFDCIRCPVAEFFAGHDASELCVQTFCRLDFPLAQKWGGQLQRSGKIASSAEHSRTMSTNPHFYPRHHRSEVDVRAEAKVLFAHLDDHRRLAGHMEQPSLMKAGATMRVETDALKGQAVGSVVRITGRVLGVNLAVDGVVTERVLPLRKTWATRGQPQLLVIGSCRIGFTIAAQGDRSRLVMLIDYELPTRGFAHGLALDFSAANAAWCTRRRANDAESTAAHQCSMAAAQHSHEAPVATA